MSIILLHIQKQDRRETLARALEDDYEVLRGTHTTPPDRQEDLLILDHSTLERSGYRALDNYKMDDPRPESPILLLVPSPQTGTLAPTVWTKIDEVVEIPVRWPEMNNRIQVLLRMQEHAREGDHFRELAAKYKVMLETQQRRLSGYKTLFRNGACGAFVVQELEVVAANSQAEQLFGGDDLVGTPFASLLPASSSEERGASGTARALTDLSSQEKRRTEQEFVRPNGETFSSPITLRSLEFEGDTAVQILFSVDCNDPAKRRPTQTRPE